MCALCRMYTQFFKDLRAQDASHGSGPAAAEAVRTGTGRHPKTAGGSETDDDDIGPTVRLLCVTQA